MGDTARGALIGLALGDALGKPTEFLDTAAVRARYGPWRRLPLPDPALVTDDTQMTVALGLAVEDVRAAGPFTPEAFAAAAGRRFVAWAHAPDNNRAPGITCLDACAVLSEGLPWPQASRLGSKGCGANMRVAPLGLVPGLTAEQRRGAAQLQSALTHGHPTALAASELTAEAVALLAGRAAGPRELLDALLAHCATQREVWRSEWIGPLAEEAGAPASAALGWDECSAALERLRPALADPDPETDPCLAAGDGWVAEEALAAGLLCFLLLPDDPVAAVRRAACSRGDSDSVACLAGAFAGALHGAAAWPAGWDAAVEPAYRERLVALADAWDAPAP